MKIALELGNRRLEWTMTWSKVNNHFTITGNTKIDSVNMPSPMWSVSPATVEDEVLTELKDRFDWEPEVKREPLFTYDNFDDLSNGDRIEVQYTIPSSEPHTVSVERKQQRCPCIEGNNLSSRACVECMETGTHSGGCYVSNCERGWVIESCYCTRPGYNLCFECVLLGEHSPKCTNCYTLMPRDTLGTINSPGQLR